MSLAQSDEVKTAVVNHGNVTGDNEQISLDAQEDREIVGFAVSIDPSMTGDVNARILLHVGTQGIPAEARDNLSFHYRMDYSQQNNTTDGVGWSTEETEVVTFGRGEGFEWNEDATLTSSLSESAGSVSVTAQIFIYYVEV